MSRRRRELSRLTFGPPGICDACGKRCITLDQVGIVCYHCSAGVFMHRSWWAFSPCPLCTDAFVDCQACRGTGVIASAKEDLSRGALREAWRALPERYLRRGEEVPSVILERARWAQLDVAIGEAATPLNGRHALRNRDQTS